MPSGAMQALSSRDTDISDEEAGHFRKGEWHPDQFGQGGGLVRWGDMAPRISFGGLRSRAFWQLAVLENLWFSP